MTVQLRVEGDDVRFVVPAADGQPARIVSAGSLRKALDAVTHEPPRADELELAIAEIEDLLAPVTGALPPGALATSSAALRDVGAALGPEASIDDVEALFNRLADVASGMPTGALGVPASKAFAVHLLLLRETMHHAGFATVSFAR